MDWEGFMAFLRAQCLQDRAEAGPRRLGSPGPRSPIDAITASEERATADMVKNSIALPRCFAWPTWLAVYFRPAIPLNPPSSPPTFSTSPLIVVNQLLQLRPLRPGRTRPRGMPGRNRLEPMLLP